MMGPRVPDRPDKAESAERNRLMVRMLCVWHGLEFDRPVMDALQAESGAAK